MSKNYRKIVTCGTRTHPTTPIKKQLTTGPTTPSTRPRNLYFFFSSKPFEHRSSMQRVLDFFTVISQQTLHDVGMEATELRGDNGLMVLKLKPLDLTDTEATFDIAFLTPPSDSSGT